MNFPGWLKRITGLSITVNFNGPTLLNFGRRGKRGKAVQLPRLLPGSASNPQRRPLKINLAPSGRDRLLAPPTNQNIRASWQAVAAEIERQQKRI